MSETDNIDKLLKEAAEGFDLPYDDKYWEQFKELQKRQLSPKMGAWKNFVRLFGKRSLWLITGLILAIGSFVTYTLLKKDVPKEEVIISKSFGNTSKSEISEAKKNVNVSKSNLEKAVNDKPSPTVLTATSQTGLGITSINKSNEVPLNEGYTEVAKSSNKKINKTLRSDRGRKRSKKDELEEHGSTENNRAGIYSRKNEDETGIIRDEKLKKASKKLSGFGQVFAKAGNNELTKSRRNKHNSKNGIQKIDKRSASGDKVEQTIQPVKHLRPEQSFFGQGHKRDIHDTIDDVDPLLVYEKEFGDKINDSIPHPVEKIADEKKDSVVKPAVQRLSGDSVKVEYATKAQEASKAPWERRFFYFLTFGEDLYKSLEANNDATSTVFKTKYEASVYAGIQVKYTLSQKLFLYTHLIYQQKNAQLNFNVDQTQYDFQKSVQTYSLSTTKLHYLQLPVCIGWQLASKHQLMAGAGLEYLISTNGSIQNFERKASKINSNNGLNVFGYSLLAGYNAQLPYNLGLSILYGYGLNPVIKSQSFTNVGNTSGSSLKIGLSYKF